MKTIYFYILLLSLLLLPLLSGCISSEGTLTTSLMDTTTSITSTTTISTTTTITTTTTTTTTILDYLLIAREIADRKYIKYGYDCNDKAMDFCKLVHAEGYRCKVCWGWYAEKGIREAHAWSIINVDGKWIHIEATGGYIIPENVLAENYIVHHCR